MKMRSQLTNCVLVPKRGSGGTSFLWRVVGTGVKTVIVDDEETESQMCAKMEKVAPVVKVVVVMGAVTISVRSGWEVREFGNEEEDMLKKR